MKSIVEKHWDGIGENYNKVWNPKCKELIKTKEKELINDIILKKKPKKVLDIGVGNGRILEILNENKNISEIYGIDLSKEMIVFCKEKFKNQSKVKELKQCDISSERIPFNEKFDMITSIRVLKYNKNWKEIIGKINNSLDKDGVFIFTMLNANSITRFSKYPIPLYRTTFKELKEVLRKNNFSILKMQTFSRIPDYFYDVYNTKSWCKFLKYSEKMIELFLGRKLLGRIIYVVSKKKE